MSLQTALPAWQWHHITRFIGWHLTSQTSFMGAIWILYLQHRGYSLTEIGLAEAAFHLAPVLVELPSGSFADLIGRRWSLALSSAMVLLSNGFLFHAGSLPVVLIAMFFTGASYSFRSGADQAFLFDALSDDQRSRYGRVFGRLLAVGYLVSGATNWIGAMLSEVAYGLPLLLSGIFAACGIVLAIGLTEPPRERAHIDNRGLRDHIADVGSVLRERPAVAAMLGVAAVFWVSLTIAELYVQAVFSDRGLGNGTIGLLIGTMFVAISAGTAVGGQLRGGFAWQWPVLVSITGGGVMLIGVETVALAVGAFFFAQFASGVIETRLSAWYNAQLPSSKRATVLSIESWLFSCLMIGLFPLAGWVAGRHGWAPLYIALGVVGMVTAFAAFLLRRHPETAPQGAVAG